MLKRYWWRWLLGIGLLVGILLAGLHVESSEYQDAEKHWSDADGTSYYGPRIECVTKPV